MEKRVNLDFHHVTEDGDIKTRHIEFNGVLLAQYTDREGNRWAIYQTEHDHRVLTWEIPPKEEGGSGMPKSNFKVFRTFPDKRYPCWGEAFKELGPRVPDPLVHEARPNLIFGICIQDEETTNTNKEEE